MPELPDVVVYIEALTARVVGQPLQRINLLSPFVLRSVDPPITAVHGRLVRAVRRVGKRIVLQFDDDLFLVLHLMIAGRLRWREPGQKPGMGPKLILATLEFPNNYTAVYTGTMIESLEDGGIVLRGTDAMMKLTRAGFEIYEEGKSRGGQLPPPMLSVKSTGDGTKTNLQNWLDCVRNRKQPNANIRAGVEAARASHLANQAMREGRRITL